MSVAEKLLQVADNMRTIKDKIGSGSNNSFLFPYINSIAFHSTISEVTEIPNIIDLSSAGQLTGFLDYKNINFEYIGIKLSRCATLQNSFRTNQNYVDKLKEIEIVGDTSTITTYINAFSGRKALEKITGELNFSNSTSNSNTFFNCVNLQEITITPNSIYKSIDFGNCSNLSEESRQSIYEGLADLTGSEAQTLTVNTNTPPTNEQAAIATNKNWYIQEGEY